MPPGGIFDIADSGKSRITTLYRSASLLFVGTVTMPDGTVHIPDPGMNFPRFVTTDQLKAELRGEVWTGGTVV